MNAKLQEWILAHGGELRDLGGCPFARFQNGGAAGLATVNRAGELVQLSGPADAGAIQEILGLLEGSKGFDRASVEWLVGGLQGWMLMEPTFTGVKYWLQPLGGTQSFRGFDFGKSTRFVIGRRMDEPLRLRGEALTVHVHEDGTVSFRAEQGDAEAPPEIVALAGKVGVSGAGKLWRFRPGPIRWPGPPTINNGAIFMTLSRGGGIRYVVREVGPFSWLEVSQQGPSAAAVVEATLAGGEPRLVRAYTVDRDVPSDDVIKPEVMAEALCVLLGSVEQRSSLTLQDVLGLARPLGMGTVLHDEPKRLGALALGAWSAPRKNGNDISFTTHLEGIRLGLGENLHGVFSVSIRLEEGAASVTRVCDGLHPDDVVE
jgi:hypothetical protein